MAQPGLTASLSGHVAVIEITRPEKKNALTQEMWLAIAVMVRDLSASKGVRALVLTGAGGNFCAGADISEFETLRKGAGAARYEAANSEAFRAIRDCPVPTVAAIDGICFGGGFGLASACDLRIASPKAMFSVPAAKLGLAYPVDAMADIVHALGPQLARYLAFTAGRLDAASALATDFLLEVTDQPNAFERALEIAQTIALNAPLSVAASKASIRAVLSHDGEDISAAGTLGARTFASLDYEEGLAAFRERRQASFTGR